jgi:hypothetical protein
VHELFERLDIRSLLIGFEHFSWVSEYSFVTFDDCAILSKNFLGHAEVDQSNAAPRLLSEMFVTDQNMLG